MNTRSTVNVRSGSEGIYLIAIAVLLVALFVIIASVFGISLIGANKAMIQNISNLAAQAAIEEFINAPGTVPGNPQQTYTEKADAALSRANQILAANHLISTSAQLGSSGLIHLKPGDPMGDSGGLQLGSWYASDPDPNDNLDPCSQNYPCFVPNNFLPSQPPQGTTPVANAAQITVRNQNSNPILLPLASFINQSNAYVQATSTAAVAQRCAAFLLDVSRSTYMDTHPLVGADLNCSGSDPTACPVQERLNPDGTLNPNWQTCVSGRSSTPFICLDFNKLGYVPQLATFEANNIEAPPGSPLTDARCALAETFDSSHVPPPQLIQTVVWCNIAATRPTSEMLAVNQRIHYRSDYSRKTSPLQDSSGVYVDSFHPVDDSYWGSDPFTSLMGAYNSGFRALAQTSYAGDKVMLMAFTGNVHSQIPQSGMTGDIRPLVQLTNANNRGLTDGFGNPLAAYPELHSNYLDFYFFSLAGRDSASSSTNIIQAIDRAAYELTNNCPTSAMKYIFLGSDFVGNSKRYVDDMPTTLLDDSKYSSDSTYQSGYRVYEKQLLTLAPASRVNIVRGLISRGISLTSIISGQGVRPHFRNIWDASRQKFLTMSEARALGYGGVSEPPRPSDRLFVDLKNYNGTTEVTPAEALTNFARPGWIFGRALGAAIDIAFQTGGNFCPLMPICSCGPNCYEDKDNNPETPKTLKDSERTNGSLQTCAVELLTPAEQAAACVRGMLGQNPFQLVEQIPAGP